MKAIILGSGKSLEHYRYVDHIESYVIGANDAIKDTPTLNAVVCADPYRDILAKRPDALDTPKHMEFWARAGAGWESWATKRGNCNLVHTTRFNIHWKPSHILNVNNHLHGYHTPFFCASVAMKKGYDELYFYGIDGDCFSPRNCFTIITELNALHEVTKGVWLCKESALWDIQNDKDCFTMQKNSSKKIRVQLNVNEV